MYKEALIVVLIILFIHTIILASLFNKYFKKDHSAVEWNQNFRNEFVAYYNVGLIKMREFNLKHGVISIIINSRFSPFKEIVSLPMMSKKSDLLWFVNFHELSHSIQFLKKEYLYKRFLRWTNYIVVFVLILFVSIILSSLFKDQLSLGVRIFLSLFMLINTLCYFYYKIFIIHKIEIDANNKTIEYVNKEFPEKHDNFLKYSKLIQMNSILIAIYELIGFCIASLLWIL